MTIKLEKTLYTAHATLDRRPRRHVAQSTTASSTQAVAAEGAWAAAAPGTNPEQLFAAGYSACFIGAMKASPASRRSTCRPSLDRGRRRHRPDPAGLRHRSRAGVTIPGMDKRAGEELVKAAHEVCPYSNATRGNIDVTLTSSEASGACARQSVSSSTARDGVASRHGAAPTQQQLDARLRRRQRAAPAGARAARPTTPPKAARRAQHPTPRAASRSGRSSARCTCRCRCRRRRGRRRPPPAARRRCGRARRHGCLTISTRGQCAGGAAGDRRRAAAPRGQARSTRTAPPRSRRAARRRPSANASSRYGCTLRTSRAECTCAGDRRRRRRARRAWRATATASAGSAARRLGSEVAGRIAPVSTTGLAGASTRCRK